VKNEKNAYQNSRKPSLGADWRIFSPFEKTRVEFSPLSGLVFSQNSHEKKVRKTLLSQPIFPMTCLSVFLIFSLSQFPKGRENCEKKMRF
jgi:hypothetical protein